MLNRKYRKLLTGHKCPECESTKIMEDYSKAETYCTTCGLILSTTDHYVGVEKIRVTRPYPIYRLVENIHYKHTNRKTSKTLNYQHTLTDKQIIKHNKKTTTQTHKPYIYHIMD